MKKLIFITKWLRYASLIAFALLSCQEKVETLSHKEILQEIKQTRTRFWEFAKEGKLDSMLSFHLISDEYKLYKNGNEYGYHDQAEGHKGMQSQGVRSMDFKVQVSDQKAFSDRWALETWNGINIISYASGRVDTSDRFIVTVLYSKTSSGWKFYYLHSSGPPK